MQPILAVASLSFGRVLRACSLCAAIWFLHLSAMFSVAADLKLPANFGDRMVLQRDRPVPIWGWAVAGARVTVQFADQTKTAIADADGQWLVKLDAMSASADSREVCVSSLGETLQFHDVLVGEVWLASGQSNMELSVRDARGDPDNKSGAVLSHIRLFSVGLSAQSRPQCDCQGQWVVSSPNSVGEFSAVAYFFGRELQRNLGVPVGLICSSSGGSSIEAWVSRDAQAEKPWFQAISKAWEQPEAVQFAQQMSAWLGSPDRPRKRAPSYPRPGTATYPLGRFQPATLFNGMIRPLARYAIRGVIWYQGESNTTSESQARLYADQLPLLIGDWRSRWEQGQFPFLFVQLPNFQPPGEDSPWALIREAMLKTLQVPHTGMAVTIDLGESNDLHPKNKLDVGRRLAALALAKVYGEKTACSGPLPAGHEVRGGKMVLSFQHTEGGLFAKGGELKGFVIAGEDRQWKPATARIKGDKVIVSRPSVKRPVAVRYAWAGNPACNLYNRAGLPASPFRTDEWK